MDFPLPDHDPAEFFQNSYRYCGMYSELASSADNGQQASLPTDPAATYDGDQHTNVCPSNQSNSFNASQSSLHTDNAGTQSNCDEQLTSDCYFSEVLDQHNVKVGSQPEIRYIEPANNSRDGVLEDTYKTQMSDVQADGCRIASSREILDHLDNILRDQVSFELDQFSSCLHDILDKQLLHVHNVLTVSQNSNSKDFDSSADNQLWLQVTDQEQNGFHNSLYNVPQATEDAEKMTCIVQMFISASVINNALAHKDNNIC